MVVPRRHVARDLVAGARGEERSIWNETSGKRKLQKVNGTHEAEGLDQCARINERTTIRYFSKVHLVIELAPLPLQLVHQRFLPAVIKLHAGVEEFLHDVLRTVVPGG